MRKTLLGASALALATVYTSNASAADFDMGIGGYFETQIGYATTDAVNFVATDGSRGGMNDPVDESEAKTDGVDVKRDNEIHFKPSITLDNGIEIGAHVELEGASAGDQIDNAFIAVDGSFGRLLIGSESSAGNLMHYSAPSDGMIGANDGDITNWIVHGDPNLPGGGVGIHGSMATNLENAGGDTERITYFTPRMDGLQFGVSYARDGETHSNNQVDHNNGVLANILDLGLNYVGKTSGIDIAASVRYGVALLADDHIEDPADPASFRYDHKPTVWSAGLNLGWRNWTIGGSFGERNENGARHGTIYGTDISIESADRDGQAYDAGISYAIGPWTYSATFFHGETTTIQQEGFSPTVDPRRKESLDNYVLGVKFALAKGVDIHGFAAYSAYKRDGITGEGADKSDGYVVGSGMIINF